MSVHKPEPTTVATACRIAIVASRFNQHIVERLVEGAVNVLQAMGQGVDAPQVVWVPGAFELPLAAQWLALTKKWDAVVCLGCVIRGGTNHYDYVCSEAARGIMQASLTHNLPVLFGVLTCNNEQQALDRAGGQLGNKGADVMQAALEMVQLRQQLHTSNE